MSYSSDLITLQDMIQTLSSLKMQILTDSITISDYIRFFDKVYDQVEVIRDAVNRLELVADDNEDEQEIISADDTLTSIPSGLDESIRWDLVPYDFTRRDEDSHRTSASAVSVRRAENQSSTSDWSRFYTADGMPRGMF